MPAPLPFQTRLVINRARVAAARLDAGAALETLETAPAAARGIALERAAAILGSIKGGEPWTPGRWVTLQVEFNELLAPDPGPEIRVYVGTPREFYRNHAWRAGTRHWVRIQEEG